MATWMGIFPRLVRWFQFYFGCIKSQNHFHGSDFVCSNLAQLHGIEPSASSLTFCHTRPFSSSYTSPSGIKPSFLFTADIFMLDDKWREYTTVALRSWRT